NMKRIMLFILFMGIIAANIGLIASGFGIFAAVLDVVCVIFFLIYLLIFLIRLNSKTHKEQLRNARLDGATDYYNCEHMEGLGIGERKMCELRNYPDRLEIRELLGGRVFSIPYERLRSLEWNKDWIVHGVNQHV
ncbi:hypothetical protein AB4Z21_33765, partial [Paenibacillus sp. MCAF20]